MRREFSKQVRRDAFARAAGLCEGKPYRERCCVKLTIGKFHYDHDIPDGLGGEPTLDNCVVLCIACHKDKTSRKRNASATSISASRSQAHSSLADSRNGNLSTRPPVRSCAAAPRRLCNRTRTHD